MSGQSRPTMDLGLRPSFGWSRHKHAYAYISTGDGGKRTKSRCFSASARARIDASLAAITSDAVRVREVFAGLAYGFATAETTEDDDDVTEASASGLLGILRSSIGFFSSEMTGTDGTILDE